MIGKIKQIASKHLQKLNRNRVYTIRSGLCKGLKRRGGLGFIPKWKQDADAIFLSRLSYENKVVYDVGGFIGLMTLFFADRVGTSGQVVTFEPVELNQAIIRDHLELNQFSNVRVLPIGLGASRGTSDFIYCVDRPGYSTAHENKMLEFVNQADTQLMQIEIYPLDDIISDYNLPAPDFVKIDVEGMELAVLQGMKNIIQDYHPDLFIELHGQDNQQIAKDLLGYGYQIRQIRDDIIISLDNLDKAQRFLYAW